LSSLGGFGGAGLGAGLGGAFGAAAGFAVEACAGFAAGCAGFAAAGGLTIQLPTTDVNNNNAPLSIALNFSGATTSSRL